MSITAHKTLSARLAQRVRAASQLDEVLAAWINIYHTHSENNIIFSIHIRSGSGYNNYAGDMDVCRSDQSAFDSKIYTA